MPTVRINRPAAERKGSLSRVTAQNMTQTHIHATNKAPPALGAVTNSRDYGVRFAPPTLDNNQRAEQKLPHLAPKPPTTNKPHTDAATSRLVTKYWTTTRDRFARLSSNTAPAKLQTTPDATSPTAMLTSPISRQLIISPMRPIPPAHSPTKSNPPQEGAQTNHKKITIVKTAQRFRSPHKATRPPFNRDSQNDVTKYHALRSHSYTDKLNERPNERNITVTFQDLAQYSQQTMEKTDPQRTSQLLYNSYMDVQHFRKLLPVEPHANDTAQENSAKDDDEEEISPYVNYCDDEKTQYIESWLKDVDETQRKEGKCTNVIDNSLKILPFLTEKR